jgi:hypothetical protein
VCEGALTAFCCSKGCGDVGGGRVAEDEEFYEGAD